MLEKKEILETSNAEEIKKIITTINNKYFKKLATKGIIQIIRKNPDNKEKYLYKLKYDENYDLKLAINPDFSLYITHISLMLIVTNNNNNREEYYINEIISFLEKVQVLQKIDNITKLEVAIEIHFFGCMDYDECLPEYSTEVVLEIVY